MRLNWMLYLLPPLWIDGLLQIVEYAHTRHAGCGGVFEVTARSGVVTITEQLTCSKCGATRLERLE